MGVASRRDRELNPERERPLNRLFVPLASEPFDWFASRRKRWEVRRARGAFRPDRLTGGRPVELRRGYSTPDRLHAAIGAVVTGDALGDLLARVPWALVIPSATSQEEAVDRATSILGPKPGPFVAFECVLE